LIAVLTLSLLGIAGCGSDSTNSGASAADAGSKPTLVVFGASSLEPAFEAYADNFPDAEIDFSFAGSDTLAAQIRQGIEPDVFAAANTTYPEELHKAGLLKKPQVFATNRLVLAVPAGSDIDSVEQAAEPGVAVAIGAEGVPVGDYTRAVIGALPQKQARAILGNVASEEPDVAGIAGKLSQGAVDAGFVYRSDVAASDGALTAVALPAKISPDVSYGVGVGAGAAEPKVAQQFIDGLLDGAGAAALADNGFGVPGASGAS
jgi:molybdate transport system substrate-binding protein